jgi:hypothetical protein
MRTRSVLVILFILIASAGYAQVLFPGGVNAVKIGDGWVPCNHPLAIAAGLGCVPAPQNQSPFPGGVKIGDGWVPCNHPLAIAAGLGCVPPPNQPPFPGAVKIGDGWVPCDHPLAVQAGLGCGSGYGSIPPTDLGTRFELGKTYESPYGFRVTIIGTARKTDGTYVFVGEVIKSGGYPKVGELLSFPVGEDRGPFQFEVPSDQVASSNITVR